MALENDPMRERALSSGANRGGDAEAKGDREGVIHFNLRAAWGARGRANHAV